MIGTPRSILQVHFVTGKRFLTMTSLELKEYEQNCTTASQIVTNCTVEKAAILEYKTGKRELCVKYMCGTFEGTDWEMGTGCQDPSYPDCQNSPNRESHFGPLTGSLVGG